MPGERSGRRGRRWRPRSPSATSGGRKARAMPWPSTGEKLPLVTSPDRRRRRPGRRWSARGGRRPSVAMPRRRRATPALLLGRRAASRPAEVALVPAHHPAQPGLQRGDARAELVAVQRQPGLEPQRVAGAEAGGLDAGGEHGVPEGAGVGRPARRSRRRPRRCSRCRRRRSRRPSHVDAARRGSGRPRPPRAQTVASRSRAAGPARRGSARVAVTSTASPTPSAPTHPGGVRGVGHDVEALVVDPPHDDVVEHRGVGRRRAGACTGPGPGRSWPRSLVKAPLEPVEGVGARRPARCRGG